MNTQRKRKLKLNVVLLINHNQSNVKYVGMINKVLKIHFFAHVSVMVVFGIPTTTVWYNGLSKK